MEVQSQELALSYHSTVGFGAETVATKIESDCGDANVEEVLGDDVHLVPLAHLTCFKENESQLHQDNVHRGNNDPVLEKFTFETLGPLNIVFVGLAGKNFSESEFGF